MQLANQITQNVLNFVAHNRSQCFAALKAIQVTNQLQQYMMSTMSDITLYALAECGFFCV